MDETIIIQDYTSQWVLDYKLEENKIKGILGTTCIQIEHIGSTSVEMLGSKPIIDMMCGVYDLADIDQFKKPLKEIGYEFIWHEEFPERRFFRKGKWRAGTHHLHIYQYNSIYWSHQILFRDYLRQNETARKEYYDLKVKLSKEYPNDRVAYTIGKNDFIKAAIKKAQENN